MTAVRPKTRAERQAELMAQTREKLREATSGISDAIRGVEPSCAPAEPAPTEPAERGQTATEQLQALRDLRHRSSGPIVPRPIVLTLTSVRTWLRQVADIGSPGDVEVAWHSFSNGELKKQLGNEYKRIKANAGPRYHALVVSAAREEQERRLEQQRRAAAAQLAKEIVRDQARLAEKRRRLETQQA